VASYYVNLWATVNGSGASRLDPFNSFASLPTLVAGDIVEVEPNTDGQVNYTVSGSGTAASPIIIRRNPSVALGKNPTLNVSAQNGTGILISSRSDVRLENLNIEGLSVWTAQDTSAVLINGA